MFSFRLFTIQALSHKIRYINFHVLLSIMLFPVFIHIGGSKMHVIFGTMSLHHQLLPKTINILNT